MAGSDGGSVRGSVRASVRTKGRGIHTVWGYDNDEEDDEVNGATKKPAAKIKARLLPAKSS